jgi:ABC-2 type transport system ATP-binding protein
MASSIEIKNLHKKYKDIIALDNINLKVPKGKIFGLIGPNGAGKTTLIKTLVGLLKPTRGQTIVLGLDPIHNKNQLKQFLGYMPQTASLYEDLSAKDNVKFFAEASNIKNIKDRVTETLGFVELGHRSNNKVHTFSDGMKKRVSLACALVHNPKIIFLDEPTAAIDPELKMKLWELFRRLADQGSALFVSTHLMDEAMYCDQVAILRQGKIVLVSSPGEFLQKGKSVVKVTLSSGKAVEKKISASPKDLADQLKSYGLNQKISSVEINNESFDEILLSIIDQEK